MEVTGYCRECQRPMGFVYKVCQPCKRRFVTNGYEDKRITFGQVGRSTINHQQSLHTKFFDCNAPMEYRGKREERIYYNIDQRIINAQARKLHTFLFELSNKHGYLYRKISSIPNITKRMLYNSTLFYLHYIHESDNQLFNTHMHLKSSLVNMVLISIENTYLRTNNKSRQDLKYIYQERQNYNTKTHDNIYNQLEECCDNIIDSLHLK